MKRIAAAWMKFWFEPSAPTALGMARLLFAGILFLHYLPVDFSGWSDVSRAFWFPGALVRHVPFAAPPAGVLLAIEIVWKLALALAALGLFSRVTLAASFLGALYLLALRNGFVEVIYHEDAGAVFGLGILALARAGDACSLDRLLRHRAPSARSGEYTWPIRLMQCLLACVFFAAGLSKLRHSGWTWPTDVFPTLQMAGQYGLVHNSPLLGWSGAIFRFKWLGALVGTATVALELGYPLALAHRLLRVVIAPAMVVLLVAIRLLMGPCFIVLIAAHVCWVPWRARSA